MPHLGRSAPEDAPEGPMTTRRVALVCSDGEVQFTDGTSEVFDMDHEGVYVEVGGVRQRFREGDALDTETGAVSRPARLRGQAWADEMNARSEAYRTKERPR